MELKVTYKACGAQSVNFSFNLDSAYKNSNGDPVYKLAKVETNTRNVWHLIITVQLIDGSQINFTSKEFRIRTKPKTLREPAGTNTKLKSYYFQLKASDMIKSHSTWIHT